MDLKKLQDDVNARWDAQDDNPCHGSSPEHALVHMMKALGKVASAHNGAEHDGRRVRANEVEKYLADVVICAARYAGGIADLDAAREARLREEQVAGVVGSSPERALVGMMTALGNVASVHNDAEHDGRRVRADEVEKPLADLVICAARYACGIADLDAACEARLQEKFPMVTVEWKPDVGFVAKTSAHP